MHFPMNGHVFPWLYLLLSTICIVEMETYILNMSSSWLYLLMNTTCIAEMETYILNVSYSWLYLLMSKLFTLGSFWLSTELPMQMQGKNTHSKKEGSSFDLPGFNFVRGALKAFRSKVLVTAGSRHRRYPSRTRLCSRQQPQTPSIPALGAYINFVLPKYGK